MKNQNIFFTEKAQIGATHQNLKDMPQKMSRGAKVNEITDIKDIAKAVRDYVNKNYPECKFSVKIQRYSGGQSMSVTLLEAPFNPLFNESDWQISTSGNKYFSVNHFHFERNASLTPEAIELFKDVRNFYSQYNYNHSDPQSDYFNVRFYEDLDIGQWDKGFVQTKKKSKPQRTPKTPTPKSEGSGAKYTNGSIVTYKTSKGSEDGTIVSSKFIASRDSYLYQITNPRGSVYNIFESNILGLKEAPMPEPKFKVGDLVKPTDVIGEWVVINIEKKQNEYIYVCENLVSEGYRYFTESLLTLITKNKSQENKPEPKFKKGDFVKKIAGGIYVYEVDKIKWNGEEWIYETINTSNFELVSLLESTLKIAEKPNEKETPEQKTEPKFKFGDIVREKGSSINFMVKSIARSKSGYVYVCENIKNEEVVRQFIENSLELVKDMPEKETESKSFFNFKDILYNTFEGQTYYVNDEDSVQQYLEVINYHTGDVKIFSAEAYTDLIKGNSDFWTYFKNPLDKRLAYIDLIASQDASMDTKIYNSWKEFQDDLDHVKVTSENILFNVIYVWNNGQYLIDELIIRKTGAYNPEQDGSLGSYYLTTDFMRGKTNISDRYNQVYWFDIYEVFLPPPFVEIENLVVYPSRLDKKNWFEATASLEFINEGWRLPTKEEFEKILYPNKSLIPFANGNRFWTNTDVPVKKKKDEYNFLALSFTFTEAFGRKGIDTATSKFEEDVSIIAVMDKNSAENMPENETPKRTEEKPNDMEYNFKVGDVFRRNIEGEEIPNTTKIYEIVSIGNFECTIKTTRLKTNKSVSGKKLISETEEVIKTGYWIPYELSVTEKTPLANAIEELKETNDALWQLYIDSDNQEFRTEARVVTNDNCLAIKEFSADLYFDAEKFLGQYFEKATQPIGYDNTQLTREEFDKIVNSKEFINWFGDFKRVVTSEDPALCSKVLKFEEDDKGNQRPIPKIVYHGTWNKGHFSRFKFNKFPVIYFATNKSYAEWFAKLGAGIIYECFLDIKYLCDFRELGLKPVTWGELSDYLNKTYGIKLPENTSQDRKVTWAWIRNDAPSFKLINTIKEGGFTGMCHIENNPQDKLPNGEDNTTEALMIFNPEQAKLVRYVSSGNAFTDIFFMKKGGKVASALLQKIKNLKV